VDCKPHELDNLYVVDASFFPSGGEEIELTEYLTPRGRPIPVDSRSHDRWFPTSPSS
jgi:hypothetical protein